MEGEGDDAEGEGDDAEGEGDDAEGEGAVAEVRVMVRALRVMIRALRVMGGIAHDAPWNPSTRMREHRGDGCVYSLAEAGSEQPAQEHWYSGGALDHNPTPSLLGPNDGAWEQPAQGRWYTGGALDHNPTHSLLGPNDAGMNRIGPD
eukprot:gene12527-14803_t